MYRKASNRQILQNIERKLDRLMATVEEVTDVLTTLTTDLEGVATTALAEFAKLEAEIAADQPVDLDPLKAQIEALDTKVKAVVVPTD